MLPSNLIGDPLAPEDVRRLCEGSWLTPELIAAACVRRFDEATARQALGRNGSEEYRGIAFPYIYPGDSHVTEWRIRRDVCPINEKGRPKGKYLTPPGRGNRIHFSPGVSPEQLSDTSLAIALTEGEKKGYALDRLATWKQERPRWLAVSIPGVWSWRGTIGKDFNANGARCDVKGVIADFDRLTWEDRRAYIVFDANVSSNASVEAARRELAKELTRRGADVRLVNLPEQSGGVDDLLVSAGPETVLRLFDEAAEIDPSFRLTELGLAERFAYQHGARLRFCHAWGKWLVWDGARWKVDDTAAVERLAVETVRSLYAQAAKTEDSDKRAALAKFAARSEARATIQALLGLARSIEGIPVRPDDLDADSWLLNCQNGTLDLRTGKLRTHRRADLLTKLCPVAFDAAATAPTWTAFLDRIMDGNAALIQFLQRAAGYALTGDTSEQVVFILWGAGSNGKSTLLETLSTMLADYALSTPPETFEFRSGSGIPNDLARLKGARLVTAIETEDGRRLAESRIKQMTGGDRIAARFLHQEFFEFRPEFKVFLATNHKPDIQGTDHAIWRRIRLVPFTVTIPDEEQDKRLDEKLRAELPGILAWAVRGCLDWQREGLGLPDEVRAATEEYRSEADRIGRFLQDCCVRGEYFQIRARRLYQAYRAWATEAGEKDFLTETAFGRRLAEMGIPKEDKKRRDGWYYPRIGLRVDDEAE